MGCGALGCEYLKGLALMGATAAVGEVIHLQVHATLGPTSELGLDESISSFF